MSKGVIIAIVAVVAVVVLSGPLMGMVFAARAGMPFAFAGAGGLMMLVPVLFWLALIGGIVWLAVKLSSRSTEAAVASQPSVEPAADILRQRYARGEISREEYLQMQRDLEA